VDEVITQLQSAEDGFQCQTLSWGGWSYHADSLKDVLGTFMTDCLKPLVAHASENMDQIIPYQLSVVLVFAVPVLEVRSIQFTVIFLVYRNSLQNRHKPLPLLV